MPRRPDRRHAGMTLAELLVVVAILSIAAAIALPQASSITPHVVDGAAAEVAHAIRFARREAMRTGRYHVAEIDPARHIVRIHRLSSAGTAEDMNPVMRPVSKQPYLLSLATAAPQVSVDSAVFTDGKATSSDIAFGPDGTPLRYVKGQVPALSLSANGIVILRSGAARRSITVDKTTGRPSL